MIQYDSADLIESRFVPADLLSTETYFNYTGQRGGLPSDGAIPTGGQLVRVTSVDWNSLNKRSAAQLVWSSQSFTEGEYADVCSTPLYGPKRL